MQKQKQIQKDQESNLVQVSIKFPPRLKEGVQDLIDEGHFKTFSDVIITGTRQVVNEYHPQSAANQVRRIRDKLCDDLMKRAKGDKKKARELMMKEQEEILKEDIYQKLINKHQ